MDTKLEQATVPHVWLLIDATIGTPAGHRPLPQEQTGTLKVRIVPTREMSNTATSARNPENANLSPGGLRSSQAFLDHDIPIKDAAPGLAGRRP
jgi:hypothetical protein